MLTKLSMIALTLALAATVFIATTGEAWAGPKKGASAKAAKSDKDTHAHKGEETDYTLKEVMQHLAASQAQLHLGLLSNNRLMILKGAMGIAHHPMPKGGLKPYIKKNHKKLMPTIKAMDEQVHNSSVKIAKSAKTAPLGKLQTMNDHMVQGCIGCHLIFRD